MSIICTNCSDKICSVQSQADDLSNQSQYFVFPGRRVSIRVGKKCMCLLMFYFLSQRFLWFLLFLGLAAVRTLP